MSMRAFLLLSLLFCLSQQIFSSDEDAAARIILHKSTKTNPVVEGKDFVVDYRIINTGDATATKIEVVDRYDATSFELMTDPNEAGNVAFSVEELAPGAQASFNVTVRPKLFGVYESTRARLKYNSGFLSEDNEEDIRSGSSSSLGRIRILSAAEYLRSTSYYIREWSIFASAFAIAILAPFLKWWKGKASIQSSKKRN